MSSFFQTIDNFFHRQWAAQALERLNRDKERTLAEQQKEEKLRVLFAKLAAGTGSPDTVKSALEFAFGVSLDKVPAEYQSMFADALRTASTSLKPAELAKLKSAMPWLNINSGHHDLAQRLKLSLNSAANFSPNQLRTMLDRATNQGLLIQA